MDAQVFVAHRAALEEQLPDNSLLFLFAGVPKQKTLDMDYPFRVDNNYYYMTGFDRANWFLMLSKLQGKVKEWLFIERPDPYLERYFGKMPDLADAAEQCGVRDVYYLARFDWEIGRLLSRSTFETLLFDFHKRELNAVSYPENEMPRRTTEATGIRRAKRATRTRRAIPSCPTI